MARLARRRIGMMSRPPRAWCVAVRASDSRIMRPVRLSSRTMRRAAWRGMFLRIASMPLRWMRRLLAWLCRPVYCDKPYNTVEQMMKKLGWSMHHIRCAMKHHVFQVRKIPHLDGKIGWPVPVLSTHRPLEPVREEGGILPTRCGGRRSGMCASIFQRIWGAEGEARAVGFEDVVIEIERDG